jgi:hypothetical protein
MLKVNCVTQICLLLLATFTTAQWASSQAASQGHGLTLAPDKASMVRFFYQPLNGEYFHFPLVFQIVNDNDPRLNTAPQSDTGRTAYISLSEMQRLIAALSDLRLLWRESEKVESLETYQTIHLHSSMRVKVFSSKGTAEAAIRPGNICKTLAPLDAALETPRALWEFQLFRAQYHCKVPNFNPNAYPERIP